MNIDQLDRAFRKKEKVKAQGFGAPVLPRGEEARERLKRNEQRREGERRKVRKREKEKRRKGKKERKGKGRKEKKRSNAFALCIFLCINGGIGERRREKEKREGTFAPSNVPSL